MRFGKTIGLLLTLATVMAPLQTLAQAESQAHPSTGLFTVLQQGTISAIDQERFEVIRNKPTFKSLWKQHNAAISPPPPLPNVDFSKDMVIAVFSGNKNTGGYVLNFDALENRGDRLEAILTLSQPGNQCMVAQVITAPFVIVKTRRTSLDVSVKLNTRTVDGC